MSIDMIYLLSQLYENVYIVKPNTSRHANSEKYIVCKKFKLDNVKLLIEKFYSILDNFSEDKNIIRLFTFDIPLFYKNNIEDINAILGQQQLESISNTLNLIDNNKFDKLEAIKKNNIRKCIDWCNKYKVPCNKSISQSNIFINKI